MEDTMMKATEPAITIVPANQANWDDLQNIFGKRGEACNCCCQRYKLAPREAFKHHPAEVRANRLREQTGCGRPDSPTTSGLVAYLGGEPVGWCAVEPRTAYIGLLRAYRVPWENRNEDKGDSGVWAVTCLLIRAGFRRRGLSRALARSAVDFARSRGARALESYPMITKSGQNVTWGEMHVGSRSVFAAAGLKAVSHPTPRRLVMRIEFAPE
jgi:GNAT superfamily N-acetyltransferase